MQLCKYCNSLMSGETETISGTNHYRFFYSCPKCQAVCEGERKVNGKYYIIDNVQWHNPNTKQYED